MRPEAYPTPDGGEVKLCNIEIMKTRILVFLAVFVLTTGGGFSGGWHGNGNWHGYPNRGGITMEATDTPLVTIDGTEVGGL
jgi:hypothetical protein